MAAQYAFSVMGRLNEACYSNDIILPFLPHRKSFV